MHHPTRKEIVEKNATTNAPTRETTRQVLAELDIEYKEVYGKRNLTIAKEIRMNCSHMGQQQLVWVQIMIHQQTPVIPLPAGFCWDVVPGTPLQIFLCLVSQITATLLTIWQVLLCIYKCPENLYCLPHGHGEEKLDTLLQLAHTTASCANFEACIQLCSWMCNAYIISGDSLCPSCSIITIHTNTGSWTFHL